MEVSMRLLMVALVACVVMMPARGDEADVLLKGRAWNVRIEPRTFRVVGEPMGAGAMVISEPVSTARDIAELKQEGNSVRWSVPSEKLSAEMRLEDDVLDVRFVSTAETATFSWPSVRPQAAGAAFILPMYEGVYVPADDEAWATFLKKEGPLDTTSGLSMPFWGVMEGGRTVTYLLSNPFNNEVGFDRKEGRLGATLTHAFTRNHVVKEFGVRVVLGEGSPVAPAQIYRRHLVETGQFVSMAEKIKRTPDAAKLLGAAHVYLWGDGVIGGDDFADVKRFAKECVEGERASKPSIGKRVWTLMDEEGRGLVKSLAEKDWIDRYDKGLLADQISRLLERRDFYDGDAWQGVELSAQAKGLLKGGLGTLSDEKVRRLNCVLLHDGFGDSLKPVETWGEGVSLKMIDALSSGGLDRLWLGVPDWKGLRNHPEVVQRAVELGYLIGPYDSFHSIHRPGEPETWETAQFDQKLYDTGGVIKADGKPKTGFKKKGYILNSTAARPYVERRVRELMKAFACNSWFVDCDADGELFDDYSPAHPATQEGDMRARLSRLAWIRDTFGAVIGSERGSFYSAGTIHFAHGMMTPVIGWGDPDLTGRKSPYYLGAYYPADGPACFFKQVPMKPEYQRVYADPRFRLPLYQMVFHDSVITTHQWGFGSLKFKDDDHARELLELLYNVPPLYHLNTAAWQEQKEIIKRHYAFFSPLHRLGALLPMTGFNWLTEDRRVQRATYGDKLELIANFGDDLFVEKGTRVPARSILARRLDTGTNEIYSPADPLRKP